MNILEYFTRSLRSGSDSTSNELPEIYPMSLKSDIFIKSDMLATYTKILTDTFERTHGLSQDNERTLWDSCVQTEASEGLVTLLANAMVDKTDLFLVYKSDVLRKATNEEQNRILADYKLKAESAEGVFISFKNYKRTDMLRIYSDLEYCVLSSLYKTVNVSKAVQVKINDLRKSVSLADASLALAQAQDIARALARGSDVAMDAKDLISTSTPAIEPTEKAIAFLDSKKAFILGLPMAYVSGIQTAGIGSTGEADMRAVERGLKQYFVSIVQPVCKALFDVDVEFRSLDFRQVQSALEVLKAFELASDEYLSRQAKTDIVRRMFELDPEQEEANLEVQQREEPQRVAGPVIRQIANGASGE